MRMLLLLPRERDGAEDGNEDEDRGDLEGEQQSVKRIGLSSEMLLTVWLRWPPRLAVPRALRSERKTKLSRQKMAAAPGNADDVGGAAAAGCVLLRRR